MLEGELPIHAHITFEPIGRGTRIRFSAHGQATGPMRLLEPLLRIGLRRQFAGHCARLKQILEQGPSAS
jgi:hypothetical protein